VSERHQAKKQGTRFSPLGGGKVEECQRKNITDDDLMRIVESMLEIFALGIRVPDFWESGPK
jgi:hypothetical protein